MANGLQKNEQFQEQPIPWQPRIKGIDALVYASFYRDENSQIHGADALAHMYELSPTATEQIARTYSVLLQSQHQLRAQGEAVRTQVFANNRAAIPLSERDLLNRQLVAWEFQEGGMATLGRKVLVDGRPAVAALPAVILPQINPVPESLVLGVAGIIEPGTPHVMVRDDLNPAKQVFRQENWDLYASIMMTHFRAAYGGHLGGISNKSHLATALGFTDAVSNQRLQSLTAGGVGRSLHTGHALPNNFLAAVSGGALWSHMSIIELPVTSNGPAVVTSLQTDGAHIAQGIDTNSEYTLMIQAHHIDVSAREAGRLDLRTPDTLQIGDMDPLTAMMYASIVQEMKHGALDGLRGTIHTLGE